MPKRPDRIRLDTAAATLVFDLAQGCAALTYAGARLPLTCDLADLGRLGERAVAPNQPDQPQPASILPNPTRGNPGIPDLDVAGEPALRIGPATRRGAGGRI
ncbi:MAG: hypothetical protein ACO3LH_08690 [Steroidobacteraceae bacterium]